MNAGGRGRDEDVVRALRAESERRWQARRQRRARIAKVALGLVASALGIATVVGMSSKCKPPPPYARRTVPPPPVIKAVRPPPVCPHDDGLEDDDRVAAITREFQALRASARRSPSACWRSQSCTLPADDVRGDLVDVRVQYARCFQAAPSARGTITVKAAVARDGRVRTRVVAPLEASALGRCLAAAVASVGFPRSSGFDTEIPFQKFSDSDPPGCPETVTARRLRLFDEAMETVARTCGAPNGPDVCAPGQFPRTFGERLAILEQNREAAERQWLQALESDHDSAASGLAWLRSRKALPLLRKRLVGAFTTAWDVDGDTSSFCDAHPSPQRRMVLTAAIEHVSGQPLRQVVQLKPAERRTLRDVSRVRMTDACLLPPERTYARWLLHKLDGVPLENPAWKIPANIRCRPGSAVAIAY